MIVMGAGTNHWFHSDQIYRAMLSMVVLCGCQGVNGGGWAHYVGQEKVRPITGFSQVAFALDWNRPPRHQAATPFWYLATEQWRYEAFSADELASPLGEGSSRAPLRRPLRKAARMGWLPAYPSFDRNPLDLTAGRRGRGHPPADYVVRELKAGTPALRRRGPRRARELPAGPDALARQPVRLLEQGARVLPQAPARRRHLGDPRARSRRRSCGRRRSSGATRRPRRSSTCWSRSTSA